MKKITIDNAEYVVYGNNEKKDNLKPHIEVAETGIVPEGKQRGLLLFYNFFIKNFQIIHF